MLILTLGKNYFPSDNEGENIHNDGGAVTDYSDNHSDHKTDHKHDDFLEKMQNMPFLRGITPQPLKLAKKFYFLWKAEITSFILIHSPFC